MSLAPFEIRTRPLRGTPHTVYTVVYADTALGSQISKPSPGDCIAVAAKACEAGLISRAELARLRKIAALNDVETASNVTLRLPKNRDEKTRDEKGRDGVTKSAAALP